MKGQVVGITTAKYSGKSSTGASIEGIGFAIPMDDVLPLIRELQENGYIKTPFMGVTVAEMNADMKILAQAYNMPVGLTVQELEPDGPALAAGIQVGDVILALDGKSITSINELSRALRDYKVGDAVTVSVFRAGIRVELTLVLAERPRDLDSTPQMVEPSMPGSGDYND
jgi:serine protease Do